jgi:hypothetical protein
MRPFHSTLTPARIHQEASALLSRALPWKAVGHAVSVKHLLDLLLLMAAKTASLTAIVARFFAFSHVTARSALEANLPALDLLTDGLVQALHDGLLLSAKERRRGWLVAFDTHLVPYYGRSNPYLVGGPKKLGTKWFYAYATAVLLHRGRRYTVGLVAVLPHTPMHEIVGTLLEQIARKGLKIKGVVLDSGFDSGDTLLLLQERSIAYTVPLRRKGNARNRRNRLFDAAHGTVAVAEWTTDKTRRRVSTAVVVWRGRPQVRVFAFGGWGPVQARRAHGIAAQQRRLYRRRFGIETSYRQKNQAQAPTTSADPVYRLLLEGVAYLLRQLWVRLSEAGVKESGASSGRRPQPLRVCTLLDWLVDRLQQEHPERLELVS